LFQDITLRRSGRRSVQDFTARERQVAQLIVEGNNNKQIAHLLGISVKTVESHRAASMRKAGTRTAATFVRFVIKHRLVDA
jgi:FixJ family two-component response regulator